MFRTLMTRFALVPALATLAAAVLFVVVTLGWVRAFNAPLPAPGRQAPPAPLDASAGTRLFGTAAGLAKNDALRLLGVLSFDRRHAAAIVGVGDEPARVIRVGGSLGNDATLAEVRAQSIIVESNGLRREITLPAPQTPNAFVR